METIRRQGITTNPEYIQEFTRELNEENRKAKNRIRTFVISDGGVDRHNTVLNMDGWDLDNYNRNPIVSYQHQGVMPPFFSESNPDHLLGPGRVYLDQEKKLGKILIGEADFETKEKNPLADKLLQKIDNPSTFGPTIRATSVSFAEIGKREKRIASDGTPGAIEGKEYDHFEGQELVEWGPVHVGSNPRAVKRTITELTAYLKATFDEQELEEIFEKLGFKFNHILEENEIQEEAERPNLEEIEKYQLNKIIKKFQL